MGPARCRLVWGLAATLPWGAPTTSRAASNHPGALSHHNTSTFPCHCLIHLTMGSDSAQRHQAFEDSSFCIHLPRKCCFTQVVPSREFFFPLFWKTGGREHQNYVSFEPL